MACGADGVSRTFLPLLSGEKKAGQLAFEVEALIDQALILEIFIIFHTHVIDVPYFTFCIFKKVCKDRVNICLSELNF